MKKFKVSGIFTDYIYAENEEAAMEKFDEFSEEYIKEPYDEIICEEMPLSHEKI